MVGIHLKNLLFFSFHGIHEEEKILGNEYEVNADIMVNDTEKIDHLHQTVDYATVYTIIKERMTVPTKLLETVAQDLVQSIHEANPQAISINISIRKKYTPITAIRGSVSVSCYKEFIIS